MSQPFTTTRTAHGHAPTTPSVRVEAEALGLTIGGVRAVQAISLVAEAGQVLCLLGPSGSGKSSLLRLLAGLARPTAGRILMNDVEVAGPATFVAPEHRRIGMVFQDYALFPHLSVADNVAFGLRGQPRAEIAGTVAALLDRVRIAPLARRFPHTLSGGERQRVALARALAPAPRVLLMDEPFSSLDGALREDLRDEAMDIVRASATTTIVVTHEPDEALCIADRVAIMESGRLVAHGTPAELAPAMAFSRASRRSAGRGSDPAAVQDWLTAPGL